MKSPRIENFGNITFPPLMSLNGTTKIYSTAIPLVMLPPYKCSPVGKGTIMFQKLQKRYLHVWQPIVVDETTKPAAQFLGIYKTKWNDRELLICGKSKTILLLLNQRLEILVLHKQTEKQIRQPSGMRWRAGISSNLSRSGNIDEVAFAAHVESKKRTQNICHCWL